MRHLANILIAFVATALEEILMPSFYEGMIPMEFTFLVFIALTLMDISDKLKK